ncbi:MAG: BatA and WFA domain-containing protein [Planctomycetaceae bacterium]
MSFGVPTALFWLALGLPIIALYVLKVRLRRVPVSTSLFWKQIYDEKPPRSLWRSLRHLLSLLLQLMLLLLLILAVADPRLPWQSTQGRRIVLVLDRSASMQADDIEPTRFSAAILDAHRVVDGVRARDEMAIVLAGARPQVKVGMNGHLPTLRRALAGLTAQDGPTELEPAVRLARQLIGEHSRGQVIVLTDGCSSVVKLEESVIRPVDTDSPIVDRDEVHTEPDLQYRVFATEAPNVGITQFQVRRSLSDPLGYEILSQVRNSSAGTVKCRLELELNGSPVDILPLTLEPNEVWSRSIEKTSPAGGVLSGRLTEIRATGEPSNDEKSSDSGPLNCLSVDDFVRAVLPNRDVQNVLIVTPGNLFLQKVFEANPLVAVEVVQQLPELWPPDTLIVLHQMIPAKIPAGDVLVVDPTESSDLWTVGELLKDSIVTDLDTASRLMTHVRLDNVWMPEARKIIAAGANHVLAGTVSGDPIYVELMRDQGRCLLLSTDLEESDLAFRTAFPILVSNALGWFAGTSGELTQAVVTGDVTTVELHVPAPEDEVGGQLPQLQLISPDGRRTGLAISTSGGTDNVQREFETTIGPLNQAGVYRIVRGRAATSGEAGSDDVLTTVAVNLSNARESDLRPSREAQTMQADSLAVAGWLSRPVWVYLAVMAGLLTVTEWILYNRRFTD